VKSSQSNFDLRSPGSFLVHSYLITTINGTTPEIHTENEKLISETQLKFHTILINIPERNY
jgi:hypothetical protein